MPRRPSTFLDPGVRGGGAVLALLVFLLPRAARAQACCAGASALTPGRLAPYEEELFGAQAKGALALGSFDDGGTYHASPPRTGELDLEEDLFASVRATSHAQVTLLTPLVQTWRRVPGHAELGGGVGDVNLSGRWDFTFAGASRYVPGIAALAGVTLPTGTPPDEASEPLATDATGVGAVQGNGGVGVEQRFGAWLVSASALVALRGARTVSGVHEALGPQLTAQAALVHTFENEMALGGALTFAVEGDARIDGKSVASTGRRSTQLAAVGLFPLNDAWRLQASASYQPPIGGLGRNLPASVGGTFGVLRGFP